MSFRLKTILGIALIELTVMAILIGINQFALGGSASTQLYERAEATARVFANAVSDAVIATDLATLDATVATAMETEDITYLRVRSPSGFVLSEAGDADALAMPFVRDPDFETATNDHHIDIDTQIVVQGTSYGTIEMAISTLKVENEIAHALRLNLLVAVLGMSLVAIFGYGLGTVLTRQLHLLQKGARAISDGDLDHHIDVRGRDELAETAVCFNDMAQTLSRGQKILKDQRNRLLEKKARVSDIVTCMTEISENSGTPEVPDTDRDDEIGDMARATVVFRDAMQKVEQARLEQQRLISAFDQVAEQVVIFGLDGKALFLNGAFREFNQPILQNLTCGFTHEEFLREGCDQGQFGVIEDKEAWLEAYAEAARDGAQEIHHAPDRILLTVETDVDGIGKVVSAKDVTDLRQSERQLVQASKMATLGEMATGIAHELNQPLGVIRMAASNCVKRIDRDKADFGQLKAKFERIGEQTERAARIIDQMRVFGRKAEGSNDPIDLTASLTNVAQLARTQLHTLDITLKIDLPDEQAFAMGEKILFEQVLLNLISNARDAIEEAGIEQGIISLKADYNQKDGHVITLSDNGSGIPEHVLDKLFEPFFTTKEPGKGTGLGLSISFGTIQDMGGCISATNTETGAQFQIFLPDAEVETALAS
ncbi:C4-dicarboxylate transport sensor protein DctB [Pelagimonas phthalicica]|uniref:histidine kinase n=1 Tax=Pelagimonas phthalicica TaxID=1037362 RepID=A0A238J666_9RHOB|nr:ATP-binding protein [Pelagimonas phthalicica]TDS95225.1 phospho-acceptor domain-containing protein [Pelagimonas phthalicica]SMX26251.1 C4-dicarboxylate transport sensor protein DctB [Pelagimonas phthalicica]